MKRNLRIIVLLLAILLLFLTSCTPKNESVCSEDILTQTVIPQGKTPVTILVKYAFSINTFEEAAE
ncbi:MAG: multiple sugar-binding protein, partial [Christensenellaceae bacterium]